MQNGCFLKEHNCTARRKNLPFENTLKKLFLIIDSSRFLSVGGHVATGKPTSLSLNFTCATLLVREHQDTVNHQGRHFTEGATHAAGFWIIDANYATCRKVHGKTEQ